MLHKLEMTAMLNETFPSSPSLEMLNYLLKNHLHNTIYRFARIMSIAFISYVD
jgi:hypothetical protein